MGRKVTETIVDAFLSGQTKTVGNTHCDGSGIYLHGNLIAIREADQIYVSNAGWFSNTTKERLNGIPGVSVSQIKGEWYLNGEKWDGKGEFFNGRFKKI